MQGFHNQNILIFKVKFFTFSRKRDKKERESKEREKRKTITEVPLDHRVCRMEASLQSDLLNTTIYQTKPL